MKSSPARPGKASHRSSRTGEKSLQFRGKSTGERLDRSLQNFLRADSAQSEPVPSNQDLRRAILGGLVFVNGHRQTRPDFPIREGDHIRWKRDPENERSSLRSIPAKFDVLYEGEGLLIVDKPAGLPTHRTSDPLRPNLFDLIRERYPSASTLHRLDADTSGLLLFTTDPARNAALSVLFEKHEVLRTYLAVVKDSPLIKQEWIRKSLIVRAVRKRNVYQSLPDSGTFPVPVHKKDGIEGKEENQGLPAETHFRCLARIDGLALIEVRPVTGRPHQIRVHLSDSGLPIMGDRIYGSASSTAPGAPQKGLMLHAWKLLLVDPSTGRRLAFESGRPARFPSCLAPYISSESGRRGKKSPNG